MALDVWLGSKCASVTLNRWITIYVAQGSIILLRFWAFLSMIFNDNPWCFLSSCN